MSTHVPLVKICGIRSAKHAQAAALAGADMVGLVFAPSRRGVDVSEARAITQHAYERRPQFVGVFVNETADTIASLTDEVGLDVAQLSGDESPEECDKVRIPFIKVIHVFAGATVADLMRAADAYPKAMAIMLDSAGAGQARWGGSGLTVETALAAAVVHAVSQPVMLAGGLRPETVGVAVRQVQPWGVDVSGGVETDGEKDVAKIAEFVKAAKSKEVA